MNERISVKGIKMPDQYSRILFAAPDTKKALEMIDGTLYDGRVGSYPLYAFFLYSDMDEDLAEFIRLKGHWLHCLSGESCLIGVFENPKDWGEGWQNHWKEKLGPLYWTAKKEWMELKSYDRNTAFFLAELLGIEKNALPCMVFVESPRAMKVLYLPIVANKSDYQRYFQDIFTAVSSAAKADTDQRLQMLHSEWGKIWMKWILPRKVEKMSKTIQKWGSIIKETTCAIVGAGEPFVRLFGWQS